MMGRDDVHSVRAQRIDSRLRPAAGCVGRALGRSVGSVAVQSRVTRLAHANPCAAAPASLQRSGPPAMTVGTAAAASTVVARSSAQTRSQMRLTRRALASDLESTPNEAADVPAAGSRSWTATGSARVAPDSPACPASRVLLQLGTTTLSGRPLEKPVSDQAPHARRSRLMAQ